MRVSYHLMAFKMILLLGALPFTGAFVNLGDNGQPPNGTMYLELDKPQQEHPIPTLPFSFDAMEPYIDAATMETHYNNIFKNQAVKMNKLLKKWASSGHESAKLANTSLINIWRNHRDIYANLRREFDHYSGGYINHILYFSTMSPNREGVERLPTGDLLRLITRTYRSVPEMKDELYTSSEQLFGCGWVYLARATHSGFKEGEYLTIIHRYEEWTPLDVSNVYPILALDLWEHAYFKKYSYNRTTYIDNWWKTIDWLKVEQILNWWRVVAPDGYGRHGEL